MKKFFFTFVLLILGLIATAQKTEMSNYEKYVLTKEQTANPDTIVKYDTVLVDQEKPEYDDLYFQAKKTDLKLKTKELRLEKRELRKFQDSLYYDAKEDVYNVLYYTSMIYRFHRPYFFPYYNNWYGWYDPFFYDPWYWNYPYYRYPYYHNYWFGFGYNNWYFEWNWYYRPHYNNYYGHNQIRYPEYRYTDPRGRTGRSTSVVQNTGTKRIVPTTQERRVAPTTQTPKSTVSRTASQNRSTYNSSKSTYTPKYTTPRMSTRPRYNNADINRSQNMTNQQRYNYERKTPMTNTQPKSSYSAPARTPSQSRTYSAPSQNRSTYSAPSQSSRSYSAPSSSGSSSSRSSSGSSSGRR